MSSVFRGDSSSAAAIAGIDIGGANLKLAELDGQSLSVAFPMWKAADQLHKHLADALSQLRTEDSREDLEHLAVTITGEMADCFLTRAEGIETILDQLAMILPAGMTQVYSVNGEWLSPAEAIANPWTVASSNWHALGTWIAKSDLGFPKRPTLLVDIGSTTTDIIPLNAQGVATSAKTDRDRLQLSQLIYTGVERTPIAAILHTLRINHCDCPVMAERFADSLDAYLCLGASEEPHNLDTADGRPRTQRFARARLARMIGEDESTLAASEIDQLANQIVDTQTRQILHGVHRNMLGKNPQYVLLSGHGGRLAMNVQDELQQKQIECDSLDRWLASDASRCAPALAVARLLEIHLAGSIIR